MQDPLLMIVLGLALVFGTALTYYAYKRYIVKKAIVPRRRVLPMSLEIRIEELRKALDALGHDKMKTPSLLRNYIQEQHSVRGTAPFSLLTIAIHGDSEETFTPTKEVAEVMRTFEHMVYVFGMERGPAFFSTRSNLRGLLKELQTLGREWNAVFIYFSGSVVVTPLDKTQDVTLCLLKEFEGPEVEGMGLDELTKSLSGVCAGGTVPAVTVVIDTPTPIPADAILTTRTNVNVLVGKGITTTLIEGIRGVALAGTTVEGTVESCAFHCGDMSAESIAEYLRYRLTPPSNMTIGIGNQMAAVASQRAMRPHMCPVSPLRYVVRNAIAARLDLLEGVGTTYAVTGPSGCGKTASILAACWGRKWLDRFSDGVYYIDCHSGPLTERALCEALADIVVVSCGVAVTFIHPSDAAHYFSAFRGAKCLFVLDGVASAADLTTITAALCVGANGASVVVATQWTPTANAVIIDAGVWSKEESASFAVKVLRSTAAKVAANRTPVNNPLQAILLHAGPLDASDVVTMTTAWTIAFDRLPTLQKTIVRTFGVIRPDAPLTLDSLHCLLQGIEDFSRHAIRNAVVSLTTQGWLKWNTRAITVNPSLQPWLDVEAKHWDGPSMRKQFVSVYRKLGFTEGSWMLESWMADEVFHRLVIGFLAEAEPEHCAMLLASVDWVIHHAWATDALDTAEDAVRYGGRMPKALRLALTATASLVHRSPTEMRSQLYAHMVSGSPENAESLLGALTEGSKPLAWGSGTDGARLWFRRVSSSGKSVTSAVTSIGFLSASLEWAGVAPVLACGHADGTVSIWNATTGTPVKSYPAVHGAAVTSVLETADGMIATGSKTDRAIFVWDPKSGARTSVDILPSNKAPITVAPSPFVLLLAAHGVAGDTGVAPTCDAVVLRSAAGGDDAIDTVEFSGRFNSCECAAVMSFAGDFPVTACRHGTADGGKTTLVATGHGDGSVVLYAVMTRKTYAGAGAVVSSK